MLLQERKKLILVHKKSWQFLLPGAFVFLPQRTTQPEEVCRFFSLILRAFVIN